MVSTHGRPPIAPLRKATIARFEGPRWVRQQVVVKRAEGWWIQGQSWSAQGGRSLRRGVFERVLQAIRDGDLPPGSRLPSARQLAKDWGVTRGTIDEAFADLQADGHIERHVGKGSYVSRRPAPAAPPTPVRREPNLATRQVLARLQPITDDPSDRALHEQQGLRLRPQITDVSSFPLALWRRTLTRALDDSRRQRLSWGPAAGTHELREATARHLALTRGVRCDARQVLIVDSPLQAFHLIALVLLEPGSVIAIAAPGHVSPSRHYELLHMRTLPLPVDADGIDLAALAAADPAPAIAMVSPASQYPLGARLSAPRREELLRWAHASGAWIIEHEFANEIAFDHAQPAALAAEDAHESVLLVGSFSSVMYPSLRLSYLVVPERLAASFAAVRGLFGDHTAVAPQLAMAEFINDEHLATHLRRLRTVYAARRNALRQSLLRLPELGAGFVDSPAGLNLCVQLPPAVADQALVQRLLRRGVAPLALSAHCRQAALNGLVLGFGADEPAAIDDAVANIARALADQR